MQVQVRCWLLYFSVPALASAEAAHASAGDGWLLCSSAPALTSQVGLAHASGTTTRMGARTCRGCAYECRGCACECRCTADSSVSLPLRSQVKWDLRMQVGQPQVGQPQERAKHLTEGRNQSLETAIAWAATASQLLRLQAQEQGSGFFPLSKQTTVVASLALVNKAAQAISSALTKERNQSCASALTCEQPKSKEPGPRICPLPRKCSNWCRCAAPVSLHQGAHAAPLRLVKLAVGFCSTPAPLQWPYRKCARHMMEHALLGHRERHHAGGVPSHLHPANTATL